MKMKRIFIIILALAIILINTTVFALGFTVSIVSNKETVKQGDSVTVTVSMKNVEASGTGINVFEGVLEYDKLIFETVEQTDFKFANSSSWVEIDYSDATGKFVAMRSTRTQEDEEIFKVTLKLKSNAVAGSTIVKIKNAQTADGTNTINATEEVLETITIQQADNNGNNDNDDDNGNNNNNNSGNNNNNNNANSDITGKTLGNTNNDVTGKNVGSGGNTGTNNNNAVGTLPKTGANSVHIMLGGIFIIIAGISIIKYKSMP